MTDNLTFSLDDLFEELVELGKDSAIVTEEAYHALVDDTVEDHRGLGELHDDQDLESYITILKARWPEYRARLTGK
jgi:hypothetical protein